MTVARPSVPGGELGADWRRQLESGHERREGGAVIRLHSTGEIFRAEVHWYEAAIRTVRGESWLRSLAGGSQALRVPPAVDQRPEVTDQDCGRVGRRLPLPYRILPPRRASATRQASPGPWRYCRLTNEAILGLFGAPAGSVTVASGFAVGTSDLVIDVTGWWR